MSTTELVWFKSSYSGGGGGNCVEVAVAATGGVFVRDSKDTELPAMAVSGAAWTAFATRFAAG